MNQGLGALTNGVTQNVYLTTNPTTGTYLPAGSAYFPGPLAAGQYVDESLVVPGSSMPLPGTYYVVVIADANNNAAELNEANNALVSATTVVVLPEYTATVKAGVSTVLAGTPVPLSGSATLSIGGPATNKPVNILLTVRGLQRVISVVTDGNGNFSTVFTPFPTEAGSLYRQRRASRNHQRPGAGSVQHSWHVCKSGLTGLDCHRRQQRGWLGQLAESE